MFSNWQQVSYYRDKYKSKIRMTTIPNEILTEVKGKVRMTAVPNEFLTELTEMQILMDDQVPIWSKINYHAIAPRMTSVYQITDMKPFAEIKRYLDLDRKLYAMELRQDEMTFLRHHAERQDNRMIRHHEILSRVLKDLEEEKIKEYLRNLAEIIGKHKQAIVFNTVLAV